MNNENKNSFVHLHVHSEYSLLDGACRIKELISRVKELGQKAVAITDHGVMYGAVDFYKEAKANGIKPIIGCEVYVAPRTIDDREFRYDNKPYHLILLCENNEGYKNLIKLSSISFTRGFYSKPRVDKSLLRKYSRSLICLSACLAGEIPQRLSENDYEAAKKAALEYRDIFGEGNFFLELQDHGIQEQKRINQGLMRLSRETGIPLAATNDAHYIRKADAEVQNLLLCIQMKKTVFEENPIKFPTEEFYIKSYDEMSELFSHVPAALENTVNIADRCNVEFEFGVINLPAYNAEGDIGAIGNVSYFKKLCHDGLKKRYGEAPEKSISERMDYELDVIIKMGYVDYFLIVWDYVNYAKSHGIPVGPGRGSGAGSICAYCMEITDIDPIRYNLLFERFLNPERVSMPDFDIDFCIEGRQQVIDYVVRKYGTERVSQIIAFDTLKARAAIQDVGRTLGLPVKFRNDVSNLVPKELSITIKSALEKNPELKALYEQNASAKRLIDLSMKIEGMPRNDTVHAAGVVISGVPVTDLVPVKTSGDIVVTQYTMTALESLGLLKMDFLGLRNLTIIKHCTEEIKKTYPDFDINKISVQDAETYKMMSRGETTGVFQFESDGMRRVLSSLKPESLEDLIAVISLYRPGPSESIPKYIRNKHEPESIVYKHPLLKDILSVTYGCMVYQEQVMEICRKLAGYSYGRADLVRRAMAKKKHDVMEKERRSFVYGDSESDPPCPGAVANGVSEQAANEIFDEMSGFASYAFNKSHAAAYAYLSYQTAYLKCHFTKEYMAALLSSVYDRTDKLVEYIEECRQRGINILPPHVNKSEYDFSVEPEGIRYGLLAIKNMGRGVSEEIIRERENRPFDDMQDFCDRMAGSSITKIAAENLIKAGAFDGLGANRRYMAMRYDMMMDAAVKNSRSNVEGQIGLFDEIPETRRKFEYPDMRPVEEFDYADKLFYEKAAVGVYISGHPADPYKAALKLMRVPSVHDIAGKLKENSLPHGKELSLCGIMDDLTVRYTSSGRRMGNLSLQDNTGFISCTVFPDAFSAFEAKLKYGSLLYIGGKVNFKKSYGSSFVVDTVFDEKQLADIISRKKLCVKMRSGDSVLLDELRRIVSENPGDVPVCVYLTDMKKLVKPKNVSGVSVTDGLLTALSEAFNIDDCGLID